MAVMSDMWGEGVLPGHEAVMKLDPEGGAWAGLPLESTASCRPYSQVSPSRLRHPIWKVK